MKAITVFIFAAIVLIVIAVVVALSAMFFLMRPAPVASPQPAADQFAPVESAKEPARSDESPRK